jgi:hypothetical protein
MFTPKILRAALFPLNGVKRGVRLTLAALFIPLLLVGIVSAAIMVLVSPATPGSWAVQTLNGGTGGLESGPGSPPLGAGSAFETLPGSSAFVAFRSTAYDGVLLSSITSLNYYTNVATNQNCQAPYISLRLDTTGDGVADDSFNFEPCYQTGGYVTMPGAGPFQDQCTDTNVNCFPKNTWVYWDAFVGGWWAGSDNNGGPPLDSIATYLADHPTATIRNFNSYSAALQPPINSDGSSNWPAKSKGGIPIMFKLSSSVLGGFRVAAGDGWQPFDGNFDALTVGVSGVETTYDFDGVGSLPATGTSTPTCDLPQATLKVTKIGVNVDPTPVNEAAYQGAFDNGNVFRVVDCKYQYILAVQSLPGAGTYMIEIQIGGSTVGTANFDLK